MAQRYRDTGTSRDHAARSVPPVSPREDSIDKPPHGLLDTILFFIRPILPNETRAYDDGLVIKAALYSIAIPWDTIEEAGKASVTEAMGGMAVRLASNSSHAVRLKLKDARLPLIFSVSDEARLIQEWEGRRAAAQQ